MIRANGVVEAFSSRATSAFKKQHRDRKIKADEFARWSEAVGRALPEHDAAIEAKGREAIHALHDIKSLIGTILKISEKWIWEQEGKSLDDKLANAPEQLGKIHRCTQILSSLLQMTDIIANPESARFGNPRLMTVVNVLFLLKKLYEDRAMARGNIISLRGRPSNTVSVYNSFLLVPLTIIDNAIKYADKTTEIVVHLADDKSGGVAVDIASYGPLVPASERAGVFERGIRGSNAATGGSGLGLYVAQIVAAANGFRITYEARQDPASPLRGENHFMFTVPKLAPGVGVASVNR